MQGAAFIVLLALSLPPPFVHALRTEGGRSHRTGDVAARHLKCHKGFNFQGLWECFAAKTCNGAGARQVCASRASATDPLFLRQGQGLAFPSLSSAIPILAPTLSLEPQDQAGELVHRRPTSTGMMGATSATNGEAGDLYYYVDLQVRPCRTSSH